MEKPFFLSFKSQNLVLKTKLISRLSFPCVIQTPVNGQTSYLGFFPNKPYTHILIISERIRYFGPNSTKELSAPLEIFIFVGELQYFAPRGFKNISYFYFYFYISILYFYFIFIFVGEL